MSLNPKLTLMLVTPPLLWAANAVLGRVAIDSIGPLWLNALRWMVAAVILLVFGRRVLASAVARKQIAERWPYLALLGLFGIGAYNALQYMALRTSTPLNVTLIAASGPVWMMAVGFLAYRVVPHRGQLLGAVLSLAGVALVLSRGDPAALAQIAFVEGDLLMLLAIVGWSFYSWMLARPPAHMQGAARPDWNWAEFLVAQCVFGLVWATGAAVVGDMLVPEVSTQWSLKLVLLIAFVAIGPSVIAYRAWGLAVAQAGPATAAIFANLTPLFAAVLSAAIIGEWPRLFHVVAFLLIVAGIMVSSRGSATR